MLNNYSKKELKELESPFVTKKRKKETLDKVFNSDYQYDDVIEYLFEEKNSEKIFKLLYELKKELLVEALKRSDNKSVINKIPSEFMTQTFFKEIFNSYNIMDYLADSKVNDKIKSKIVSLMSEEFLASLGNLKGDNILDIICDPSVPSDIKNKILELKEEEITTYISSNYIYIYSKWIIGTPGLIIKSNNWSLQDILIKALKRGGNILDIICDSTVPSNIKDKIITLKEEEITAEVNSRRINLIWLYESNNITFQDILIKALKRGGNILDIICDPNAPTDIKNRIMELRKEEIATYISSSDIYIYIYIYIRNGLSELQT